MADITKGRVGAIDYQIPLHTVDRGLPISLALAQVASRPVLEALGRVLKTEDAIRAVLSEGSNMSTDEFFALLGKLDLAGLGGELQAALGARKDLPQLMVLILSETQYKTASMPGFAPVVTGGSIAMDFAGKYGTLYALTWKAIQANGFIPLPDFS